jgi:hypothetical protein
MVIFPPLLGHKKAPPEGRACSQCYAVRKGVGNLAGAVHVVYKVAEGRANIGGAFVVRGVSVQTGPCCDQRAAEAGRLPEGRSNLALGGVGVHGHIS